MLNIPGIDDSNLNQWLEQIKDCQSVLEISSRRSSKDYELVSARGFRRMRGACACCLLARRLTGYILFDLLIGAGNCTADAGTL